MCLMILLAYLLLLLLSYTIRMRTDNARVIRVCEGQKTDKAQGQSSPLSTPPQHIRLIRLSSTPTHGEQPRRWLAIVVNDWCFFYATPSDGIYTGCPSHLSLATVHQFLSVRCSTHRDTRTERRSKPPRVRAGLPAENDTPLDDSSYFSPQSPGRVVGFRYRRNRAIL